MGQLATVSDAFSTRWASHNEHVHVTGSTSFRHPVVGELHLAFNTLPLAGDPGLSVAVYTAEPARDPEIGSPYSRAGLPHLCPHVVFRTDSETILGSASSAAMRTAADMCVPRRAARRL